MGYACDKYRHNKGYIRPHVSDTFGKEDGRRGIYVKCSAGARVWTKRPPEARDGTRPEHACQDFGDRSMPGRKPQRR